MLTDLRARGPHAFAEEPEPADGSLPELVWQPLQAGDTPPVSRPDSNAFDVVFLNHSEQPVELNRSIATAASNPTASSNPAAASRSRPAPARYGRCAPTTAGYLVTLKSAIAKPAPWCPEAAALLPLSEACVGHGGVSLFWGAAQPRVPAVACIKRLIRAEMAFF